MPTTESQNRLAYVMRYGIARTNRFQVIIPLPGKIQNLFSGIGTANLSASQLLTNDAISLFTSFLGNSTNDISRGLNATIQSSELPGSSLVTSNMKYNGDFYQQAYDVVYSSIPFTFNASRDMLEKKIIDAWIYSIVDPVTHEVSYIDDYSVPVTINQLNEADQVVYSIVLNDAYPLSCVGMSVSNEDKNLTHRVQTTWAYRSWLNGSSQSENGLQATLLSQTALGPILTPFLSNPLVKKGLDLVNQTTGVDLTGEALNIYNQADSVVRSTTGESVNTSVALLNNIKAQTQTNGTIGNQQKAQVLQYVQNMISALGG